jgi:MraZ protein
MLRGSYPARIDDKGRLKIPTAFKALIEERHGPEVYVTSLTGESVRIYPMPVWVAIEDRLRGVPSLQPLRKKFLDRVSYYGQVAEFDSQGRVLIHGRLRESAAMTGEVDVLGQVDYLDVWNHERLEARFERESLTDEDLQGLAGFGI